MATVTFFHAHPDDEAIATGGTMAAMADQGHRVVLVTATGGELGEVPDGLLRPGETLADRRASELTEAATLLGVDRQLLLGYEDSGMEGEPSSLRAGCFATADVEEAATRLAGILTDEGSDVLVTYDEHGGYGHPDHVQVHTVGMRAAALAGTPVVYLATVDRGFTQSLRTLVSDSGWAPSEENQEQMEGADTMGEPSERITTEVDVTAHLATKRAAMRAHVSQIGEDSIFLSMPEDVFSRVWGQEWYIRVHPAPTGLGHGRREAGLLVDTVRGTLAGGVAAEPLRTR
jgi:LmbE family N-acetylglucosaminyl deacetylase